MCWILPRSLTARLVVHATLLLPAFACIGCKTFQREAFEHDIVRVKRDPLPSAPVQAGYSFRTLDSIDDDDLIVVAYVDTTTKQQIVTGEYDRPRSTLQTLALNNVRDEDAPPTLSVAFRSIQQVYPVKQYPSYIVTEAVPTLVWIFLVLPAMVLGGIFAGAAAGYALTPGKIGPYGSEQMFFCGLIGAAAGVVTWTLLTIPIR